MGTKFNDKERYLKLTWITLVLNVALVGVIIIGLGAYAIIKGGELAGTGVTIIMVGLSFLVLAMTQWR